jgi:hypothetical protein
MSVEYFILEITKNNLTPSADRKKWNFAIGYGKMMKEKFYFARYSVLLWARQFTLFAVNEKENSFKCGVVDLHFIFDCDQKLQMQMSVAEVQARVGGLQLHDK